MARGFIDNRRAGQRIDPGQQFRDIAKMLEDLVNDPKKRRTAYLSVMRKQARPVVSRMKSFVPITQNRLRNSIAARNVTVAHLRSRGAKGKEAEEPVIHVGPMRGKGTYMKQGIKTTKNNFAFYWHWSAYGTRNRTTKSGANRGMVKANNYAEKTYGNMQAELNTMATKINNQMMGQFNRIRDKHNLGPK